MSDSGLLLFLLLLPLLLLLIEVLKAKVQTVKHYQSSHLAATVTELWGNIQKETPETQANRLGCHNKSAKGTFLCI